MWITGHSFRAGGATDLFNAGVPYQVIQKQGRWKSAAVLVYFKSEAAAVCREAGFAYENCDMDADSKATAVGGGGIGYARRQSLKMHEKNN
jgi:hypothetical protein